MKKLFALMVVFAALVATGCGGSDSVPPPAEKEAAPADDTKTEPPAEPAAP